MTSSHASELHFSGEIRFPHPIDQNLAAAARESIRARPP